MIRSGIKFRLLLLGTIPAGAIGLALTIYFTHADVTDLDRRLRIRGDLIVRQLAAASVSGIVTQDQALLRHLADAALKEDDVIEVNIHDSTGKLTAQSKKPTETADNAPDTQIVQAGPILAPISTEKAHLAGNTDAAPEVLGGVKLVLSRSGTLKQQRDTILFSLLILAAGLTMTALLARSMGRKISDPVLCLTIAVHELSKGNMDVRAECQAEAELAYLQAGFNAMAAELKKNRDSLENQVRQATLSLWDALESLEKRNRELESARGFAEAQAELKSQFLAQMSHEIRTPMNGIIGFAEQLAKTPLQEDQAEKLGLITRSARNLLTIIDEILDLSKLEAGKISLNVQRFALRPCLEDVVSMLSVRVRQPAIILWIESGVPAVIEGDPLRIQQVIANLLGNAIKFTRRGRVVIRARVSSRGGHKRLMLSVSDSGSGISQRDIARLFSPFLQLGETAIHSRRGTGLGLSIAKNIVESMGGKIHLASRLGRGTSLWFDLPLKDGGATEDTPQCRCRVALIEADRLFRQALKLQLESLGARVEAFVSPEELVNRYAAADHPAILVYGFRPERGKPDTALHRCLEWCEERRIRPILLFPSGERRVLGFYQKRGATCLSHPVLSETLGKAITLQKLANRGPSLGEALPLPAPSRPELKFLLADDNEINRLLLRAQLSRFGAEIVEAIDGKDALDKLRQQAFDLVFLDLQMPVMDGQRVLRETRGNTGPNRHTQIIAITAFSAPGQRESVMRDGFADCLIKPIMEEQLLALIEERLARGKRHPLAEDAPLVPPDAYADAIVEKTDGNRELGGVIARKLFAELPENLRGVEMALRERESETARQFVHKINGSTAFSGLEGIRDIAAMLESGIVRQENWEELERLWRQLAREIEGFLSQESAILDRIARANGRDGLPM